MISNEISSRLTIIRRRVDAQNLFEPPPQADEKKTVIFEKLGRFSLEIMADELEYPTNDEQAEGDSPKPENKEAKRDHQDRKRDHRDADAVGEPIHRVFVAVGVFVDPVVPASAAHHSFRPPIAKDSITVHACGQRSRPRGHRRSFSGWSIRNRREIERA